MKNNLTVQEVTKAISAFNSHTATSTYYLGKLTIMNGVLDSIEYPKHDTILVHASPVKELQSVKVNAEISNEAFINRVNTAISVNAKRSANKVSAVLTEATRQQALLDEARQAISEAIPQGKKAAISIYHKQAAEAQQALNEANNALYDYMNPFKRSNEAFQRAIDNRDYKALVASCADTLTYSVIKTLRAEKFAIDYKDIPELQQECYILLLELLKNYSKNPAFDKQATAFTAKDIANLLKKWSKHEITTSDYELAYYSFVTENAWLQWYDIPAKALYVILRYRLHNALRAYLIKANSLNYNVSIDALIAYQLENDSDYSSLEARIDSNLKSAIASQEAKMELQGKELLPSIESMLSDGEYAALKQWVLSGTIQGFGGAIVKRIKDKLAKNEVSAEDMESVIKELKENEARLLSVKVRILKKLA